MIRSLIFWLLGMALGFSSQAQQWPRRELRAAWVATVVNIDFPRKPNASTAALQQEYSRLLDSLQGAGMNAVVVQVRPTSDALWPSQLTPWSAYLTGKQGLAPQPETDFLAWMIRETHQHQMAFHAWLNPYRATFDLDTAKLDARHVVKTHPEWTVTYGPKMYLNPALPEVRQHFISVVEELVRGYDLDAVHFDDYFYPYRIEGLEFPDSLDYARFGTGFTDKEAWRRNNVDVLIKDLGIAIKRSNPSCAFGISPFSVWRNASKDPVRGSRTETGQTNYDDLYADILLWMENGWIDYIVPQLYFPIGFDKADYATLLQWWNRYAYGRILFIGQGLYNVNTSTREAWKDPAEIPRQIRMNRESPLVRGSMWFSAKSVLTNALGVTDSLRQNYYRHPAIHPVLFPGLPDHVEVAVLKKPRVKMVNGQVELRWQLKSNTVFTPKYFLIYRRQGRGLSTRLEPEHLYVQFYPEQPANEFIFLDKNVARGKRYSYRVVAVNAYHQETLPSVFRSIKAK